MKLRSLLPLAASAALLLSTGRASAEEDVWPHLRLGFALESGMIIVPGFVTVGFLGGQVQVGVRFNKFLGLRSGFDSGGTFGNVSAIHTAVPLLVELTLGDRIVVGAGPDLGLFETNVHFRLLESWRYGLLYGGRLSFAWHVVYNPPENEKNRGEAITVGLDVRLRGGAAGLGAVWNPESPPLSTALAISPMIFAGFGWL